jgi:hypothetical protein
MKVYLSHHAGWWMIGLALACGLGLMSLFIGVVFVNPSQADMGVNPILPGGSNIKPEGETLIQMTAEKVVLTVHQTANVDYGNPQVGGLEYYPYFPVLYQAVADVTADFTMTNPTNEVVSMMAWFPLASALENAEWENFSADEIVPRIVSFQVVVGGTPLAYSVSNLPNPQGEDKPLLPWASFPVTFPAGEEVLIQVSYVIPAQPTFDFLGMTFYYVFQTGAGWAGPIGKAELVVNLPYPASTETIGMIPEGGQVEGQQVRWTWENLEPSPQDDFSILLMFQEHWDELQAARDAVKANPEDGEAWLRLCGSYHTLLFGGIPGRQIGPGFGETYQPLGVQACQEAARLLPGDCRPHYELAMLYLSTLPQNTSPEQLKPVQDEIDAMEAIDPVLAQTLQPNLDDMLEWVLYNDATATADWASWSADWATETAAATLYNDATATADAVNWACWDTAGEECTPTPTSSPAATPIPSTTPQPLPTVALPTPTVMQPVAEASRGQSLIIAVSLVGLAIVVYLLWKRK